MPELDDVKLDGEPVDDRLDHGGGLSDHQYAPAIEPVGDGAADGADQQAWQGVKKRHDADSNRATARHARPASSARYFA